MENIKRRFLTDNKLKNWGVACEPNNVMVQVRAECLRKLYELLRKDVDHPILFVGQKGVSKKKLIFSWLNYREYRNYFDYKFFISANTEDVFKQQFQSLGEAVNCSATEPENIISFIEKTFKGQKILFIYINPFDLKFFWNNGCMPKNAKLLILSDRRNHDTFCSEFIINEFTIEEAKQYIQSSTFKEIDIANDVKVSQNLIEVLGLIPSAIEQVCGYMKTNQCSLYDFFSLDNAKLSFFEKKIKKWKERFVKIQKENLAAYDLFVVCLCIDGQLISEWLLKDIYECQSPNSIIESYIKARGVLRAHFLLNPNDDHSYFVNFFVQKIFFSDFKADEFSQLFVKICSLFILMYKTDKSSNDNISQDVYRKALNVHVEKFIAIVEGVTRQYSEVENVIRDYMLDLKNRFNTALTGTNVMHPS